MTKGSPFRLLAPGVTRVFSALCLVAVFSASSPGIDSGSSQELSSPQAGARSISGDGVTLESGKTIERELTSGKKDVFQVTLAQRQLATLLIEHNLDLAVKILDPQGAVEIETESTAGHQRYALQIVAEKSATYQIKVEPQYPKKPVGKYSINISGLRAANEQDLALQEARRQYSHSLQLFRTGAYDQAQMAAERALDLREKSLGPDDPELAASLNTLGKICWAQADYKRAEELFRRAMSIDEKASDAEPLAVAEVTDNLAQNFSAKGNYGEAERLARQALAIREKNLGSDHFLVAASLESLGEIFLVKAEYSTARGFADRAMETAAKSYGPEDLPYTDAVSLLGRVQTRQGSFATAEQLLLQNLRDREKAAGPDSLQAANALQDLGGFYVLRIDNVKAEQMNLRALALKEKILGPGHLQLVYSLHNLGLIHYRRGDYTTADEYYQRALAIKKKFLGPNHPLLAPTLNNLGLMYWKQLDYAKAADYFRQTLTIIETAYGPDSIEVTYPSSNLGIIAKETGDFGSAEAYYRRSLAIDEKILGPQHPETGQALESLGILYRDKGDYSRAEPFFLRSIAITEGALGVDHPNNIRHFRNLSQLYEADGDVAKALKSLQRVNELEEKNLPLNLAVGSERQKLAYFDPFIGSLERMISFQAQLDPEDVQARDLAATALVYRKGRVLDAMSDSLGTLWNRSSVDDRAVLDQLKDVTSQLAALVLNGPQKLSIAEHQERIKVLTGKREQLENKAARTSAGYYERSQAVTLAAVQAAIPADTVLIELGVYRPFDPKKSYESLKQFGDPRYIAYVISKRGAVQCKDLGPIREIDAAVEALRQALRDPDRADVKRLARALDEKIMQPLRAFTANAKHLLVSPDGQLDLIPFEALVDEDERFLVERVSISYLTTGRDLLRMQVQQASKSGPLVIADPAFGEPETVLAKSDAPNLRPHSISRRRSITTGQDLSAVYFARLSGTAQEARVIHSLFPEAQVLTGAAATKAALKQVDAPSILHIATHGFFLQDSASEIATSAAKTETRKTRAIHATARIENPLLRSGLALSGANLTKNSSEDGILTALEAANLNLWGTKLVTLSACETGVGEVKNGEGVYGLRRSFFLAGAETLVMSLWPVSDRVTREMMISYYTGLKGGLGRGEALRQAELAMLKRKDRQHPFYWASFIQSGEWANLDGKR